MIASFKTFLRESRWDSITLEKPVNVFHASHADLEKLIPREEIKNYHSIGSWFTSSKEHAGNLYGSKVYEATIPAGLKLAVFSQNNFDEIFLPHGSSEDNDFLLRNKVLSKKELRALTGGNEMERRSASTKIYRSPVWTKEVKRRFVEAGFDGLFWPKSRIDLAKNEEAHDVYCIFLKSDIDLRKVK